MMFRPGKTARINNRILCARTLIGNFYLYEYDGGYIAFDTGVGGRVSRAALDALGVDPERVSHVFLTHSDFDHAGGCGLFAKAAIYLPVKEIPLVSGRMARRFIIHNRRLKGYKTIADGEAVTVGGVRVECVEAPGHTPGSACYIIGNEAVVTGDLLLASREGALEQFSIIQNMDHTQNGETFNRLTGRGVLKRGRYLLTGHSGAVDRWV